MSVAEFFAAQARWAQAGFPHAPAGELARRVAACALCPERQPGVLGEWCAGCGCWLAIKLPEATSTCPRGRWPGAGARQDLHSAAAGLENRAQNSISPPAAAGGCTGCGR